MNSTETEAFLSWTYLSSESAISFYWTVLPIAFATVFIGPYLGPLMFMILWYGGACMIFAYYVLKHKLQNKNSEFDPVKIKDSIIKYVSTLEKIIFGQELIVMGKYNVNEPHVFLAYHPLIGVSILSTWAMCSSLLNDRVYTIIDKHHANAKGMKQILQYMKYGAWNREECIQLLKDGNSIILAPGGSFEVRMSDENYRLCWQGKIGFAHLIKNSKAKVVFYFTCNSQENFRMPFYLKPFLRGRFSPKKLNCSAAWGGLPVKLTTLLSSPITYDYNLTVEELALKIRDDFQAFIDRYQQIPGSKWQALKERFTKPYFKIQMEKEGKVFQCDKDDDKVIDIQDFNETHSLLMDETV